MKSLRIYFVTNSELKKKEFLDFVSAMPESAAGLEFAVFPENLPEVLDSDIDRIVTQKALEAFSRVGLPCIVEQSGLMMKALPGLPGGLGQIIWNAIQDRMCKFLLADDSRAATARSVIGYCDGRTVVSFVGETEGQIAERARGDYLCNWDPIFVPAGETQTYGEMGLQGKRRTSPFYKAWSKFLAALATDDRRTGPIR
jgi:XTP/dITP diphosphohydrolase